MIANLLNSNRQPKNQFVEAIQDLRYQNNLLRKKQQRQFTQSNINQSFANYGLKYYNTIGSQGVYSSNINDYALINVSGDKETFIELNLQPIVGSGVAPPSFDTPIYFVVFDGLNVLQNVLVSTLQVPNTILSFTTSKNFKLENQNSNLYFGLFIDTNLTATQKTYIDNNISINWSIVINQNQII